MCIRDSLCANANKAIATVNTTVNTAAVLSITLRMFGLCLFMVMSIVLLDGVRPRPAVATISWGEAVS